MLDLSGNAWLEVFGRAHLVFLHLPLGVLAALVVLELLALAGRRSLDTAPRRSLATLLAATALTAAASGWCLGQPPDHVGERLLLHRNLGVALALVSVLVAAASRGTGGRLYPATLAAACGLALVTGHHGGSLTHGPGFLLEPLQRDAAGPAPRDVAARAPDDGAAAWPVAADERLSREARALLLDRCGACHGAERRKGGLALHDREAILAGSREGAVVVSGDPDASVLVQRLRLPTDHDDHMPPQGKPQLLPGEVQLITDWIAAGLPRGHALDVGAAAVATSDPIPAAPPSLGAARQAAIERWRADRIHIEPSDPAAGRFWVDVRGRPATDDQDLGDVLHDLGPVVSDLCLRGTAVGDEGLPALAHLPDLERLDLSATAVTSRGLAALQGCARLTSLQLTSTALDDTAVEPLAGLPALEVVHLWSSGITPSGVARLRALRPDLRVEDGRALLAEALETEPQPVLTPFRRAVNLHCPVTGDPVDPAIAVEHEGQRVAFCCEGCPASFLADPAAHPLQRLGPVLGGGAHRYAWEPGWLQLPEGQSELGNTHGEIVFDGDGNLYLNTDTEQAVMVFAPDGSFLRSWGAEFANGLHGMQLVEEDGAEFLYFVHFGRHEVVKATLQGEIAWRLGPPVESGLYEEPERFMPTSIAVAPDGGFFVADGYGLHWVHQYDADRRWLRALGGPGSDPGAFQTPHGVWIDTRGQAPELLVADRENHRLQRFDLQGQLLGVIEGMLRRPCKIQQRGEFLVIPDLAGRVTILDGRNELVAHLGDNPNPALRADNGVPREDWVDGEFLAPHSAAWDAHGNLYVMDWNRHGRITRLVRLGD